MLLYSWLKGVLIYFLWNKIGLANGDPVSKNIVAYDIGPRLTSSLGLQFTCVIILQVVYIIYTIIIPKEVLSFLGNPGKAS